MSHVAASDLRIEFTGMPSIVDYPPGSTYGPRTLDDYELVWLLQGHALWTCAELELELGPGSLLLLRPGFHDSFRWDRERTTRHAYVHFGLRHPDGVDPAAWPILRQMVPDDPLADLFRFLLWLGATKPDAWEPRARDVQALLVALHVSGPLPTDDAAPVPPAIVLVVEHLRQVWASGPARAMPLGELAAAASVSGVHLSRLFRRRFGLGPVAAVELLRLARAEGLLLRSNLTVAAIAAESGFADPYHFSRRFRAVYGMAPTAFRAQGTATAPASPVVESGLAPLLQLLSQPVTGSVANDTMARSGGTTPAWVRTPDQPARSADRPSEAVRPVPIGSFEHQGQGQRIVFGPGRLDDVAAEVVSMGCRRALLIVSHSASAAGDRVADGLGDRLAASIDGVRQHVPEALADTARSRAAETGTDVIVTIGGGSATGLGKAVALVAQVPLIAVPTTYAGSEVTDVYGITGEHKETGRSPLVLPKVVVYDPLLTIDLPVAVTVTSAFNALAHCIEALYPGRDAVAGISAEAGIRAYTWSLPRLVSDQHDLDARAEALFGAYLAGTAFAAAGSGLHHKLCHVLGGTFGLDHGACNAVVLPYVAEFNATSAPDAMRRAAAALRAQSVAGISPGDAAGALRDLARRTGAPLSLAEIGMPASGLELAAKRAVAETGDRNPRPPDVDSLLELLRAAHAGREPSTLKSALDG